MLDSDDIVVTLGLGSTTDILMTICCVLYIVMTLDAVDDIVMTLDAVDYIVMTLGSTTDIQ